jgi:hypothetical protein
MPCGGKMTIPCIGSFQQQQARILSEHKVGQPASVVSEFGSPLNGENSVLKHRFRRLEKGGQQKCLRQKSTTFGCRQECSLYMVVHDRTMKPDISPW